VDAWIFQKEARFKALWLCCPLLGWTTEFLTIFFEDLNSWTHAQASVMLWEKQIPLYVLFAYFWIIYCPVALTWHTNVDLIAGFVISALSGGIMWSMVDIVGANHLWWEWHSDDPLYASRFLNVPATSTMWVMMQIAGLFIAFYLVDFVLGTRNVQKTGIIIIIALCASALGGSLMILLTTILFWPLVVMIGLTALQFVILEFVCKLGLLIFLIWTGEVEVIIPTLKLHTAIPSFVSLAVTIVLMALSLGTRTDEIRSVGLHQPLGTTKEQCTLKESSFWGWFERSIYLCDTEYLPFHVCSAPESSNVTDYITCGEYDRSVVIYGLGIGYLVCNFLILTLCLRKKETKLAKKML